MGRGALIVLIALAAWGASLIARRSIPSDEVTACAAMFRLHNLQFRHQTPERETRWTKDVATLLKGESEMTGIAAADTTTGPGVPYHGYYFRALTPPPGDAYAICAYPAQYGKSKLTYFINGTGVFSKDIGGRCLGAGEFVRDGSWAIID